MVAACAAAAVGQTLSGTRLAGMKVFLVTFGSRGDVHPMLGLGRALQARGHEAVMLTNPVFRHEAARAGLGFVPVGTEDDYRQTLAHPKLWHPVDGLGVMWRYLLRPALRPTYEVLHDLCQSASASNEAKRPLVLASPMAMGARVAQEKWGIRLVTTYTAATMLRSIEDPLTMAQWRVPKAVPHWVRRGLWTLLDRAKLDPLVKPALASLRGELNLPLLGASNGSGAAVFDQWVHSPLGGLTLFPPWFAPMPKDWPVQVKQGMFALYDDIDDESSATLNTVDADLLRFLDAGPAPVVFMPGSAQQGAEGVFRSAIEACQRLGIRGILLGHLGALATEKLPDFVWAAAYHPFAPLLPRARAIVHHGGVGTCAQALRAGLAQLVWPQAYDQFDNAMRLEQLGVGLRLQGNLVSAHHLADRLSKLLGCASIHQACQHWAGELSSGPDLDEACDWLEQLA